MPTYTVFPIEPPASPSQLATYKTLRLTSLQIDPQAFLSTYAHEAAFSEDVWRARLDSSSKRTLVASVLDASHARGDVNTLDKEVGETGEWIGTARIVGPSDMPPCDLAAFKEAKVGDNWEIYGLYAMWVHPAHRGKGVGAQLVRTCLEWARADVDIEFSDENSGDFEKVVVLFVYVDNVAAHAFYSREGFTYLDGVSVAGRAGERCMLAKV